MEKVLKEYFGYDKFKDEQLLIINHILENRDNIVILPTGFGKSLCYQFPSLITNKITIVISPLIAIMEQQVDYLTKCKIKAKYFDYTENDNILENILHHQIVYITPEKICNIILKLDMIKEYIGLFAIDECHCISEWGSNFRPSYTKLYVLKQQFPDIPVIALTATASNEIESDIITKLKLDISQTVLTRTSVYRSNLKYMIRIKTEFETDLDQLYNDKSDYTLPTLIYTNTIKNTEKICNYLIEKYDINV